MKIATCFACYAEERPDDGYRLFFNTYNYNNSATIVVLAPSEHIAGWEDFLSPFKNINLYEVNYITDDAFNRGVISKKTKRLLEGNNSLKHRSGGMRPLLPLIYPEIFLPFHAVGGISTNLVLSYDIPTLDESMENFYEYNSLERNNLFLVKNLIVKNNKALLIESFERYVFARTSSLYFEKFLDPRHVYGAENINSERNTLIYENDEEVYNNLMATGIVEGKAFSSGKTYDYVAIHDINFPQNILNNVDWSLPLNFCLDQGELTYYNQ